MTTRVPSNYKTRDLAEAAAIATLTQQVPTELEPTDRGFNFVFTNLDAVGISEQYWSGQLRLDPLVYSRTLRSLKDRVMARR